jgi:secondary thiamine-phosphate synthase enzyme
MIRHIDIQLPPFQRGFHLITELIVRRIQPLPEAGLLHVFITHTSAGLTVNENADPTVLSDFEATFDEMVPEDSPWYQHTIEGPDDMPAHIKSSLVGSSVSIPIREGALFLGQWQGIYLCEFRNTPRSRSIVVTIIGGNGI